MASFNDWPIKKCLLISAIILAGTLALTTLAAFGIDIPVLRQVIAFTFLTLVPGVLILRIMKVHNIGFLEGLVYSVGLSLAFTMFMGAFINIALPPLGIPQPISTTPVTISLSTGILILMAVAWWRDRDYIPEIKPGRAKLSLPALLTLALVLVLTILGACLINAFQNNVVLIICLLGMAAIVAFIAFGKFIDSSLYPIAIFVMSLALLYQTTLISPYPIGSDIYLEYHYYIQVINSGRWDFTVPTTVNSCMSLTLLAPVYSLMLHVDGAWIFKSVYPLLFALLPLALFQIFRQQIGDRKAFLSVVFFVAVPTYILEMIALCRQQIAELFLVLLLLILVTNKLSSFSKTFLTCVFALSMAVSHYALGFIGFIFLGLFLPLLLILRSRAFSRIWQWTAGGRDRLPESMVQTTRFPYEYIALVLVYFVLGLTYYGVVASGINLSTLDSLWRSQWSDLFSGIGSSIAVPQPPPATITAPQIGSSDSLIRTALGLDFAAATLLGKIFRIFQYLTQLFIIVGCLRLIFRPRGLNFVPPYICFSITSALLLAACILLPNFASPLNTTRWYHLSLITLAPFCILGGETIWLGISSLWHKIRHIAPGTSSAARCRPVIARQSCEPKTWQSEKQPHSNNSDNNQTHLKFVALAVLIPYFFFTSGVIFEVSKHQVTDRIDIPYSIALSSYRIDLAGVFNQQDGAAAQWLSLNVPHNSKIYVDDHTSQLLKFYGINKEQITHYPQDSDKLQDASYAFLSSWNVSKGELTFAVGPGLRRHTKTEDLPGLRDAEHMNQLYCNGSAKVLSPHLFE
ncbi:MAG: DUF2206 domain-containing protein [Chloroflexi bacterium]|nr:DUF2206 domain-containing protein [Chloroflexota bacterium]